MGEGEGRWWRFSRYEIDGGYIRPAESAKFGSVDAWKLYWKQDHNSDVPPYLELVALVQKLPSDKLLFGQDTKEQLDELKPAVAKRCQRFGLLGILPHHLLSVQLGSFAAGRTGAKWVEIKEFSPDSHFTIIDEGEGNYLFDYSSNIWWKYFPGVSKKSRARKRGLIPLSEQFWQEYEEPFEQFILTAKRFANAIEVLTGPRSKSIAEHEAGPITSKLDHEAALKRLNDYASPVCQTLSRKRLKRGSRYEMHWESPSLIGHLAMQALQDLLGDSRLIKCRCSKIVVVTHHAAKYCSTRCQERYKKQAQRRMQ